MKLDRKEALHSVRANVRDKDAVMHMLAAEMVMRALARKLGTDEEEWGLTGLLHDIDVELVEGDVNSHSRLGADLARELGANDAMAHAILSHNEAHGVPRETKLDKALFCADSLSRLITASAQACPDKLKGCTAKSVLEHFKDKQFVPEVNREQIISCRELGLGLEEVIALGLEAMKSVALQLQL